MVNNEFHLDALIKTNIILSVFSFLGSLTIILLYCFNKNLNSFVFKLVFYLAISELLFSIGNFLSFDLLREEPNEIICDVQSVIINFTDYSTLTWICIISYTIYNLIFKLNKEVVFKERRFIFIGFTIPILFSISNAIVFFTSKKPQKKDQLPQCWCWIKNMEGNWIYVVILHSFYWIFIISNLFVILRVIAFLKSNCDAEDKNSWKKLKSMCNKLYMYPIISMVSFFFATVHRMYQIFYLRSRIDNIGKEEMRLEVILYLFHGICNALRGFLYFIFYGCDEKVRRELKRIFYQYIMRKERDEIEFLNN